MIAPGPCAWPQLTTDRLDRVKKHFDARRRVAGRRHLREISHTRIKNNTAPSGWASNKGTRPAKARMSFILQACYEDAHGIGIKARHQLSREACPRWRPKRKNLELKHESQFGTKIRACVSSPYPP